MFRCFFTTVLCYVCFKENTMMPIVFVRTKDLSSKDFLEKSKFKRSGWLILGRKEFIVFGFA